MNSHSPDPPVCTAAREDHSPMCRVGAVKRMGVRGVSLKGATAKRRPPETLTNADFKVLESKSNIFLTTSVYFKTQILNGYKTHFA